MNERFETFTVLITSIARSIHKIKSEEMAEFNLKSSHVSCLYYLYKQEGITARDLCDICGEDKANISRSLKFLEENDYIRVDSVSQKRYLTKLILTEKGRETGHRIADKIDRVLSLASVGVSEEERAVMYEALSKINSNLSEICGRHIDRFDLEKEIEPRTPMNYQTYNVELY